ncbi:hypothetical protein Tco_1490762 [Tanacetum coccineum]
MQPNRKISILSITITLQAHNHFLLHSVDQESWKNQSDVQNHLVEIQADDHDLLVNSNNKNDDMLGYESEKYSNDEDANETNHAEDADETNHAEDADGTDHSDLKLVKRGINQAMISFAREIWQPGGIKIKVTPPTTIQKISDYNSAPKLQSKRKNYVSRETMQRQARTGKSQ